MNKVYILSYGDLAGVDGAAIRLQTYLAYVRKLNPNCKIITICSIRERLKNYRIKVYVDNMLCFESFHKDYYVYLRALLLGSLNLSRVSGLTDILASESNPRLYVHTLRIFGSLSDKLKKSVKHIDVCDDNVAAFKQAAKVYFRKLRPHLGLILLNEARVEEKLSNLAYSMGIPRSYITKNDMSNKENASVLPNIYKPKFCGRKLNLSSRQIVYGIIGNFRTLANKSIIENFFKLHLKSVTGKVVLFGLNTELVHDARVIKHGVYRNNEELVEMFDVGLCLVTVRGGIQNKVVDYLSMGKIALVTDEVYRSISEDETFKLLANSPFLVPINDFVGDIPQIATPENYQINKEIYEQYQTK